ncbi:DnaJ family domain-containing protein [Arthrobacter sp. NPDC055585]
MGNRGADAYRRRMERAARLRAAGAPETAGEETPEEADLRRRKEQVDPASKADYLIRDAMMRGDFDNLQYAGKPIPNLGEANDPDWWVKGLIERENISGLGPPALLLRVEDAELDGVLDAKPSAAQVRETVEDFNRRIIEARRQLLGGPPVITKLRDVELEVQRWRDRRAGDAAPDPVPEPHRPWWRRVWNRQQ